jgi:hypothetical protein
MEAEDEEGGGTDAGLVLLRLDEKSYDETDLVIYFITGSWTWIWKMCEYAKPYLLLF